MARCTSCPGFHLMPCLTPSTLLSRTWVGFSWHGKRLKKKGLAVCCLETKRRNGLRALLTYTSYTPLLACLLSFPRLHAPLPRALLALLASAPTNLTCFSCPFPQRFKTQVVRSSILGLTSVHREHNHHQTLAWAALLLTPAPPPPHTQNRHKSYLWS